MEYDVVYPSVRCCQKFLLYFDESYQWDAAYNSKLNCTEKVKLLIPANNQEISLDPSAIHSGCDEGQATEVIHCKDSRPFSLQLDRWWYVAVSKCGSMNGLYMEYDVHFINPGNFWTREFSADEQGILETDISFSLLFFILLCISFIVGWTLGQKDMCHTTYKLYMASVLSRVTGLFFLCIHYGIYGNNGMGLNGLKSLGRIISAISELFFLLMLLLLAKGWTVVRGRLTSQSQMRLTILMTLYSSVYTTMFIWEAAVFDPAEVLYIYDSPAGYGLVTLSFLSFCWFTYAVITTVKNFPDKRGFYKTFYCFFALWFLARPIVVLVSNHHILDYAREKVVNGVDLSIAAVGYIIFLILTRPTAANTNFPFHIRTAQVDIMQDDESDSAHPYAVTSFIGTASPNTHELFSASKVTLERGNDRRQRQESDLDESTGGGSHEDATPVHLFSAQPSTSTPEPSSRRARSHEESVS
jgi:hypothetical protein